VSFAIQQHLLTCVPGFRLGTLVVNNLYEGCRRICVHDICLEGTKKWTYWLTH